MMLTGLFRTEGTVPSADSLCPRHQTALETDPSQRKFSGRLDVNNSRLRGWDKWRELGRQARLPEEGWLGRWGGPWKRNQWSRHLRAPENLSMFISHKHPKGSLNRI